MCVCVCVCVCMLCNRNCGSNPACCLFLYNPQNKNGFYRSTFAINMIIQKINFELQLNQLSPHPPKHSFHWQTKKLLYLYIFVEICFLSCYKINSTYSLNFVFWLSKSKTFTSSPLLKQFANPQCNTSFKMKHFLYICEKKITVLFAVLSVNIFCTIKIH